MTNPRAVYFKNLNALRFYAFFAVFLFHFNQRISPDTSIYIVDLFKNIFKHGYIGVNFFFVLSGFLITHLLLHEEKQKGNYNIKHFWIRRTLRIWPLYFATVLYGFYIFKLLNH